MSKEYPDDRHDVKIKVIVKDLATGEVRTESRWSTWDWTEGNWSCDCNRRLVFDPDAIEKSYPCETKRYKVVYVEPLLTSYTLDDFNQGYAK